MTLLAVSIAVHRPDEVEAALGRARDASAAGARLVEWRLDTLAGRPDDAEAAKDLVARSPAPSIVTCRGRAEGGGFEGDDATRAALYAALIEADRPPRYVDVELSSFGPGSVIRGVVSAALERTFRRDVHASLILSAHDLDRRPPDLLQRIEAMTTEPACSVVKVAWQARSLRDNLEAFDLLAERRKPTIALCMGPFGLPSRVLASKFGGLLVYASESAGAETAPGQPTVADLAGRHRFGRVGAETVVYGVIGWPVEHSRGPAVHNAGFDAVGHDGVYLPLPVPPEYEHFKATVGALVDHPRLGFRGASVTIPHKAHLVRFVRERGGAIDEVAERLGAANTLIVGAGGGLACTNTDAPAAIASLGAALGAGPEALAGKRVAVLGAGGVARAVVGALVDAGAKVVVFNRSRRRAAALVEAFHGRPAASGGPALAAVGNPGSLARTRFDVVVNCTPVGMAGGPAPGDSPLPRTAPLEGATVLDTVYEPARTPLLAQAEAAGATTIGGLDMFLRQAALQFESWTGVAAPREVFTGRTSASPDPP